MTLDALMRIASRGYPEDLVWQYHKHPNRDFGDTLAKFVAFELADTFSSRAGDIEQLVAAQGALETAKKQMGIVWGTLDEEIERIGEGDKGRTRKNPVRRLKLIVSDIPAGGGATIDLYYDPMERSVKTEKTLSNGRMFTSETPLEEFDPSIYGSYGYLFLERIGG